MDVYYLWNNNHPADGNNQLRNFDVKANQFSLNMAKLTLSHSADPVGFTLDLGFGKAWDVFHSTEPGGADIYRYIPQAYVSFAPKQLGGLQIDFGKFVTSAGAEPTETHLNWNYSRSLIYANGPYYHFGVRTSMAVNEKLTLGGQILNGWNNVEDNNSGKTVGLTSALNLGKVAWFNTYLVGGEKTGTNVGKRHFYDTVVTLTPNDKIEAYLNFDYGHEGSGFQGVSGANWIAIAGATRLHANSWLSFTPRLEYYYDRDGFITGTAQKLKEFTITGEIKLRQGLLARMEYRRDWSDAPYFNRGNELANSKSQSTALVGLVAYFGQ